MEEMTKDTKAVQDAPASGTEPKIKAYLTAVTANAETAAAQLEKLADAAGKLLA